jgi:hypothetical protein
MPRLTGSSCLQGAVRRIGTDRQRPLRAAGLDPEAIYEIRLVNPEDVTPR